MDIHSIKIYLQPRNNNLKLKLGNPEINDLKSQPGAVTGRWRYIPNRRMLKDLTSLKIKINYELHWNKFTNCTIYNIIYIK